MPLHTRTDYAVDDLDLRARLMAFLHAIHGLDLGAWSEAGFWDPRYRPFSTFHGEELVSNVCLYEMDMVVGGQRRVVAQISGVGTHPDYRRRGHCSELTRAALAQARQRTDLVYLFADDEAVDFYQHRGFVPLVERVPRVRMPATPPRAGARWLSMGDPEDRRLLWERVQGRAPSSRRLGVLNEELWMFHALYTFTDALWWVPELEVVLAARRREGRLTVYDVLGTRIPPLEALYPYLSTGAAEVIELQLEPDLLEVEVFERVEVHTGAHLLGEVPWTRDFIFPMASRA